MKVDVESQEPHRGEHLVLVSKQGVELTGHPGLGGGGRVVGVADAGPPGLSLVKLGHVIRILASHWMITLHGSANQRPGGEVEEARGPEVRTHREVVVRLVFWPLSSALLRAVAPLT